MAEKRYEREIDDLLRQLEAEQREPLPFRPRPRPSRWRTEWQRWSGVAAAGSVVEWLMAAAVVLLVLAFLLRVTGLMLAWLVAVLAVGCLFAALALSVVRGARQPGGRERSASHYYRSHREGPDWGEFTARLRRWFNRFRS